MEYRAIQKPPGGRSRWPCRRAELLAKDYQRNPNVTGTKSVR